MVHVVCINPICKNLRGTLIHFVVSVVQFVLREIMLIKVPAKYSLQSNVHIVMVGERSRKIFINKVYRRRHDDYDYEYYYARHHLY